MAAAKWIDGVCLALLIWRAAKVGQNSPQAIVKRNAKKAGSGPAYSPKPT
jgi:hypothetical protein